LEHRGRLLMIDCGEGAQLSMRRQGLSFSRLGHIFISHLHGDHCLGLPGLLSTMALQQKGGAVTVHTFADGIAEFRRIMDYFCRERPFELRFEAVDPRQGGVVLDGGGLTVAAFPLRHRVPCVGYLVREADKPRHLRGDMVRFLQIPVSRLHGIKFDGEGYTTPDGRVFTNDQLTTGPSHSASYAYCSDTLYDPTIVDRVAGADVLYHEATYADDALDRAAARFHSTASQAAMIARDAGVGQLVLGHFSKSYRNEQRHLAEAQAIFPNTILADEGLTIDIDG
ncbi:MAG: ribonuclease Z, partial [Muribaculaceae bacterium]|nr:ribonuclease Z [Muribaculaceae bacterium]